MNKILVGLILMVFSTSIAFADGVIIPLPIKVESFKKEMKSLGMDLSGDDDADGYVENLGTSIKVITYRPVTIEEMDLIREAAIKTVRQ